VKGVTTIECNSCGRTKVRRQVRRAPRINNDGPGERLAIDFHSYEEQSLSKQKSQVLITDKFSGLQWDLYFKTTEHRSQSSTSCSYSSCCWGIITMSPSRQSRPITRLRQSNHKSLAVVTSNYDWAFHPRHTITKWRSETLMGCEQGESARNATWCQSFMRAVARDHENCGLPSTRRLPLHQAT
jgi:hypothetical protein